ncbi:MAG: class II aldolase/adducin family protein [Clostridia bacterium]|nr:class II aldolase/adducin family protein [Clostridia bacterium]
MSDFFAEHADRLAAFSAMSQSVGARADYVQGGGGNSSVKLAGGLMAIKASGYRLSDIRPDAGYAVLDGAAVRDFYMRHESGDFANVEREGAAFTRAQIRQIDGLAPLRPSVETGFHALLRRYVIHSHSVYANLAACAEECEAILQKAFDGAPFSWGCVPYTDPGACLSFSIRDELAAVKRRTGREPAVIVMRNHGLIVHAETAEDCLSLHAEANGRAAAAFGLKDGSFPQTGIRPAPEGGFMSDTPYLMEKLRGGGYPDERLLRAPLYPDQMVFLTGTLGYAARIDRGSGRLHYDMQEEAARAVEDTLTAVVFISETLRAAGCTLSTMDEAARAFIANWESERYRKKLAEEGRS